MAKGIKLVDLKKMTPARLETRLRYDVITKEKDGSEHMSFHVTVADPGRSGKTKYEIDEVVYILEGKLTLSWDGKTIDILPGMIAFIPAGQEFSFRYGDTPTKGISVFSPPRL